MSSTQNTINYDGMRMHIICAERKTINDDNAKKLVACVEKIPKIQMEIRETAIRQFTQVTASAMNFNDGKGMLHHHPNL